MFSLSGSSKGILVPEKDSPNTAGLSLCLQNEAGYGSLSGVFAGVHDPAHKADSHPNNSSTRARNDAHPLLREGRMGHFWGSPRPLGASLHSARRQLRELYTSYFLN